MRCGEVKDRLGKGEVGKSGKHPHPHKAATAEYSSRVIHRKTVVYSLIARLEDSNEYIGKMPCYGSFHRER